MLTIKAFSSYSDLFVSPLFPERGGDVELSILFSGRPDGVLLFADSSSGNTWSYRMDESGMTNGYQRYTGRCTVPDSDEIFRYYFAFFTQGRSYYYSKKGITRSVPPLSSRFSLLPSADFPRWVAESTCYQIFPDRFFSSGTSRRAVSGEYEYDGGIVSAPDWNDPPKDYESARCLDFYGGDLMGIAEKAGYLESLGVTAVYLNPVNDARTVHRYDAVDFFHVDGRLGGDEALSKMISVLHSHGIRVILDISINHTGIDNEWYRKAMEDPSSEEASFYAHDEDGSIKYWWNVRTLPELDYRSQKLRDLIYRDHDSAMQRFIRPPFGIDGWRLDVAAEVGRSGKTQLSHEIWREVRRSLKEIKHDLYIVGEDWDDSGDYLSGDMWDGTMNYFGSGRIIRSWMGERDRFLNPGWGFDPEREAEWTGEEVISALTERIGSLPDQMAFFQMNLFDSHDTPRLHSNAMIMDDALYEGAVMALFMLPGMPSVYYGDETGLDGRMGSPEGARYPMCWDEEKWNRKRMETYRKMAALRSMPFFPYSAFHAEALDNEAFVLMRTGRGQAAVAVINRCRRERHVSIPLFPLPSRNVSVLAGNADVSISGGHMEVRLPASGSAVLYLTDAPVPERS